MNKDEFASRVRELRQSSRLSQQAAAQRLGVSRQTIFLVESGKSLPTLPLALKIAQLFNQSIDNLLSASWRSKEQQMTKDLMPISPFRGLRDLHEEIDRFFDDAFGKAPTSLPSIKAPQLNIHQDDKNLYIEAAVPGFSEDEIETEITDDYVTIRGQKTQEQQDKGKTWLRREFAHGAFERTIALPDGINTDQADATLKEGTLTITLPKLPEAKPKVKKLKPKKV